VELVENGILDGPEAYATVKASLQPLLDAGADRIVLGCTHYPFLRPIIEALVPPGVQIIDPAPAVAQQTVRMLDKYGISTGEGPFGIDLYYSGEQDSLERIFKLL
jgi:glutamate racemase